ncbi:MAG: protein kinase [Elusimicrobia bacterium]|nr:protein kinase [Elusimicrobiota bacterium]
MRSFFRFAAVAAAACLLAGSAAAQDGGKNSRAADGAPTTAVDAKDGGQSGSGQLFSVPGHIQSLVALWVQRHQQEGRPLTQEEISTMFRQARLDENRYLPRVMKLVHQAMGENGNAPGNGNPAASGSQSGTVPGNNAAPPDPTAPMKVAQRNAPFINALDQYAITHDPGNPGYRAAQGVDHVRQGDYRDGYRELRPIVEAGGASRETQMAFGSAALEVGDYDSAMAVAKGLMEADPNDRAAISLYHFALGRVPSMPLPSVKAFGAAPDGGAGPNSSVAGAAPAGAAPQPAQTPEQVAAQANQEAAAQAAQDPNQRSLGYTRDAVDAMRVRDYQAAYDLATKAVQLDPKNAQALNFRAIADTQMRRYPEAVTDASAALAIAPGSAAALQTRSWAFAKQGQYKEALADADATLENDPRNAFAYQNLAYARAGLGDRAGALQALKTSAELDPRFQARYERAVRLPQDQDLTMLFGDGSAGGASPAPAPETPAQKRRDFFKMFALAASGALLMALAVLHIVSAGWRDRMRMTVRRVLGGAAPAGLGPDEAVASPSGAFWTQYHLVKEIGLGGMGVVYEALDRSLERRVAVKKMRDEIKLDPQERARFVNEARLVAQLHHPNIVDIYGIIEDDGEVYLVFEYVEGRTLLDALKSGGPMDPQRARQVLRDVSAAVEHAHERGIIHRDLKPSNVMLTPEGRVKVMDFGVARQAKDALTRHSMMTNTIVGTPPYMAPEQEQGTVRKESDVYALGICLYEMTTGHLPFGGTGAAMLLNKLNGKHVPPSQREPTLPKAFDDLIAKALAPDPDKRFRTPAELMAALDSLLTAGRAA